VQGVIGGLAFLYTRPTHLLVWLFRAARRIDAGSAAMVGRTMVLMSHPHPLSRQLVDYPSSAESFFSRLVGNRGWLICLWLTIFRWARRMGQSAGWRARCRVLYAAAESRITCISVTTWDEGKLAAPTSRLARLAASTVLTVCQDCMGRIGRLDGRPVAGLCPWHSCFPNAVFFFFLFEFSGRDLWLLHA
jgi:hypothetical protein